MTSPQHAFFFGDRSAYELAAPLDGQFTIQSADQEDLNLDSGSQSNFKSTATGEAASPLEKPSVSELKPIANFSQTQDSVPKEFESESRCDKHDKKGGAQSTNEASSDTKEEEKLPTSSDQDQDRSLDTDQDDDIYAPNPF